MLMLILLLIQKPICHTLWIVFQNPVKILTNQRLKLYSIAPGPERIKPSIQVNGTSLEVVNAFSSSLAKNVFFILKYSGASGKHLMLLESIKRKQRKTTVSPERQRSLFIDYVHRPLDFIHQKYGQFTTDILDV